MDVMDVLPEQVDAFEVACLVIGTDEARSHGIWRNVPTLSNIRDSCQGKYVICSHGDLIIRRPLESTNGNNTYHIPKMYKHGKYLEIDHWYVHRIMVATFFAHYDSSLHVNHIDANTLNNDISNLEQVTNRQNTHDFWTSNNPNVVRKRNKLIALKRDLVTIHKGDVQKRVPSDKVSEYVSNGWKKGSCQKVLDKCKGNIWVNDGHNDFLIKSNKLQDYKIKGYQKGRVKGLNGMRIKCIETDQTFLSKTEAAKAIGICVDTISKSINKSCTVCNKYTFVAL